MSIVLAPNVRSKSHRQRGSIRSGTALAIAIACAATLLALRGAEAQSSFKTIRGETTVGVGTLEAAPAPPGSGAIDIGGYTLKDEDLSVQLTKTQDPWTVEFSSFGNWLAFKPTVTSFSERPLAESYYVVVPSLSERQMIRGEIDGRGGTVVDEPDDALIVRMDAQAAKQIGDLQGDGSVRWMGLYQPSFKLSEELMRALAELPEEGQAPEGAVDAGSPEDAERADRAIDYVTAELERLEGPSVALAAASAEAPVEDEEPRILIAVTVFGDRSLDEVVGFVKSAGGEVRNEARLEGSRTAQLRVPVSLIEELSQREDVRLIDKDVIPQPFNDVANDLVGVRIVRSNLGLSGEGQIIGHADFGLDAGDNGQGMHADFAGQVIDVVAYATRPRAGDWSDWTGHGTHTAGTILGSGMAGALAYTGVAPKAKLIHQSLGDEDGLGGLPRPSWKIFEEAYAGGARIHSDSWGTDSRGRYNGLSREADEWLWNNGDPRDILIVVAAGNSGRHGPTTVGGPATAKNVLAVGATETLRPGLGGSADEPNRRADFSSQGPTRDGRIRPDIAAPGTWIVSSRTHGERVAMEFPFDTDEGWTPTSNFEHRTDAGFSAAGSWRYARSGGGSRFQGTLISDPFLVPKGPKFFVSFWFTGHMAPTDALLVLASSASGRCGEHSGTDWRQMEEFAGLNADGWINLSVELHACVLNQGDVRLDFLIDRPQPSAQEIDIRIDDVKVTSFASWGSLSSGGLSQPGDDVDREYTFSGGTSMATPIVAGAAALVREALIKGGMERPSAELLKAMLINGANRPSGEGPNNQLGWGILDLDRTLNGQFLIDDVSDMAPGETTSYAVTTVSAGAPLRATLVWADPPGEGLRNDLDLVVTGPDQRELFGNGASESQRDDVNNVESVIVASAPKGEWSVSIEAGDMQSSPQPFALVISGDLE